MVGEWREQTRGLGNLTFRFSSDTPPDCLILQRRRISTTELPQTWSGADLIPIIHFEALPNSGPYTVPPHWNHRIQLRRKIMGKNRFQTETI